MAKIRLMTVVVSMLLTSSTLAANGKVYRCSGAHGDEYRDVPCNEYQEKRESAEYKVGSGMVNNLSLRTLAGVWCNYAKSNSIGGVRDYSDPDRWSISMNGQLEIQDLDQFAENDASHFEFRGRSLQFGSEALGHMSVTEYRGDEMILLGKDSYLFLKRGGCADMRVTDIAGAGQSVAASGQLN